MVTRKFSRVLTPRPQLSRFLTGISRRRNMVLRRFCLSWGNVFFHRESTSWNFPAKIENSLLPSFDMMSKFPGLNHSCRRRYMNKLKKGEFVSLLGNQRVGILPPKSKILFSLRISFIWYKKIQGLPSPVGGVTWSKYTECWPVRRKEEKE